jgi:hypothetical protein
VITTNVLKDNERSKNSLTAEQAVLMGTLKPSSQQQAALKMQGRALAYHNLQKEPCAVRDSNPHR